jgi:molybdenum cofactor cytidylyltransferase
MDKNNGNNIGIILLAAGQSNDVDLPIPLLDYEGQTLLQHSIEAAQISEAHPLVVVLGADAEIIKKEIKGHDVHVVYNAEWQKGMASSIRYGLQELIRISPATEAAVVLVCDQPYITADVVKRLISVHQETGKPMVGSKYADTVGTPALFHKSMFPELMKLEGEGGGKNLLLQHSEALENIPFPEGKIDIDTEADYKKLKK